MSAVMVPVVFIGVFLEARFTLGHGLQEKAAIEAATKVQIYWYCQLGSLLITEHCNVLNKMGKQK